MKFVVIYLLLINVVTLLLYGIDKRKAKKKKWRIPEGTLLFFALIGGALGAFLGMHLFRHKTNHRKFTILVPLFLVLNIAAFAAACVML